MRIKKKKKLFKCTRCSQLLIIQTCLLCSLTKLKHEVNPFNKEKSGVRIYEEGADLDGDVAN